MPRRVALRWVIRRRRFECMPNTLASDLHALALLYDWADTQACGALDERLESGATLEPAQIDALIAHIRTTAGRNGRGVRALTTVARHLKAIGAFLWWALDPANQGRRFPKAVTEIASDRSRLSEVVRRVSRHARYSRRISPLSAEEWTRIEERFGPEQAIASLPTALRFRADNPF